MASLQNLQNKEVICKIFQAKELCVILAPNDSFRLEGGSKTPGIIVRRSTEIICSHLRWGSRSLFARMDICGLPPIRQEREWMGHPAERQYEIGDSAPYHGGRIGLAWVARMESVRIAKND